MPAGPQGRVMSLDAKLRRRVQEVLGIVDDHDALDCALCWMACAAFSSAGFSSARSVTGTVPKSERVGSVFGAERIGVLNTLNASSRACTLNRSLM